MKFKTLRYLVHPAVTQLSLYSNNNDLRKLDKCLECSFENFFIDIKKEVCLELKCQKCDRLYAEYVCSGYPVEETNVKYYKTNTVLLLAELVTKILFEYKDLDIKNESN